MPSYQGIRPFTTNPTSYHKPTPHNTIPPTTTNTTYITPPNANAKVIHAELARHFCGKDKDPAKRFKGAICVKLWESHKAWAAYEADV